MINGNNNHIARAGTLPEEIHVTISNFSTKNIIFFINDAQYLEVPVTHTVGSVPGNVLLNILTTGVKPMMMPDGVIVFLDQETDILGENHMEEEV